MEGPFFLFKTKKNWMDDWISQKIFYFSNLSRECRSKIDKDYTFNSLINKKHTHTHRYIIEANQRIIIIKYQ